MTNTQLADRFVMDYQPADLHIDLADLIPGGEPKPKDDKQRAAFDSVGVLEDG